MDLPELKPLSKDLPFGTALAAKIFALCFLVSLTPLNWPEPWLPFWGLPEPPAWTLWPVRLIAFAALAAILIRRSVRTACLVFGLCTILTVLWNQDGYHNNIVYYSTAMILIGLTERDGPDLLRWFVVLVYFGAAIDKVFRPDWISGHVLEYWLGDRQHNAFYLWFAGMLPAAKIFCWLTILTELGLALAFCFRSLIPYAIPVAVAFHLSLTAITGNPFGMFTVSMAVTMLALAPWPERALVIYDGGCGLCQKTKGLFSRIAPLSWLPYHAGMQQAFGVTPEMARHSVFLITDKGSLFAFRAARGILAMTPATYGLLAGLFSLRFSGLLNWKLAYVAAAGFVAIGALILTPARVGDFFYYRFARQRYRMSRSCAVGP